MYGQVNVNGFIIMDSLKDLAYFRLRSIDNVQPKTFGMIIITETTFFHI